MLNKVTISSIMSCRQKTWFLPTHPCSPPNLTKLPFEFSDDVRILKYRKDCPINIGYVKLLSDYLNVCDVTDGQTDDIGMPVPRYARMCIAR